MLRSRDPGEIDRWLPVLLGREPDRRRRAFLRTAVRLHAAIDQVEVAVLPGDGQPGAALLTLVDGRDRWPWWGWTDVGGLDTGTGAPLVTLTDPARGWP